jgi:hypothetical protein
LLGCPGGPTDTGGHRCSPSGLRCGIINFLSCLGQSAERHNENEQKKKERSEQRQLNGHAATLAQCRSTYHLSIRFMDQRRTVRADQTTLRSPEGG